MLPRIIWAPISFSSSGLIALTEPYVPTGMNVGVSIWPWLRVSVPRRAPALVECKVNCNMVSVKFPEKSDG